MPPYSPLLILVYLFWPRTEGFLDFMSLLVVESLNASTNLEFSGTAAYPKVPSGIARDQFFRVDVT